MLHFIASLVNSGIHHANVLLVSPFILDNFIVATVKTTCLVAVAARAQLSKKAEANEERKKAKV